MPVYTEKIAEDLKTARRSGANMALECHFRIFEVLHYEREASVAEEVGITDEEELNLELHRF